MHELVIFISFHLMVYFKSAADNHSEVDTR